MPKKILIVEDEITLLKALAEKLIEAGFKVIEAEDGKQGLESALKEQPDLILLDIILPRMDGLTVLHKLQANAQTKKIPVIILTNLIDSDHLSEQVRQGGHDYLVKTDWKLAEVIHKVKERLGV